MIGNKKGTKIMDDNKENKILDEKYREALKTPLPKFVVTKKL